MCYFLDSASAAKAPECLGAAAAAQVQTDIRWNQDAHLAADATVSCSKFPFQQLLCLLFIKFKDTQTTINFQSV